MTINTLGNGGGLFSHEGMTGQPAEVPGKLTEDVMMERRVTAEAADGFLDEANQAELERKINKGCDRESILQQGLCEPLILNEQLRQAFETIRRGYPDRPEERCSGPEFRENSNLITEAIVAQTMEGLNPETTVVVVPWRAGLAFGRAFLNNGVRRFYHVSTKRNEKTGEPMVDYENSEIVNDGDTVVVADPMLATGGTAVDAFRRILNRGMKPGRLIVNSVLSAPVGVKEVNQFPGVRVITGALDEKLDHRMYIIKGLGDYGDLYCNGLTVEEVNALADDMQIDDFSRRLLLARIFPN